VEANKGEIACIIIEPVAGNMGCIPPTDSFLQKLRNLCNNNDILLIFDEVMTGFRLAPGMNHLAPLGPVYQAGTLSGNPLAMSAGLAMLTELNNNKDIFKSIAEKTAYLHKGIQEVLDKHGIVHTIFTLLQVLLKLGLLPMPFLMRI